MIVTPENARARSRFPIERTVVALGAALYFFVAILAVWRSGSGTDPNYVLPAVIGVLPICAFLAFRSPMIFPFALYVALVPFDSLLQVSGSGSTLGRVVGLATAGTMILHMLLLKRAFVPHRAWVFWGAAILFMSASLLWTSDSSNGVVITLAVVQLFGFMTVLAMYPATKTEFTVALGLTVACGVLAAGYGIEQYFTGNVSGDQGARLSLTAGGYEMDFNYFAASFILPMALATCFTFYAKHAIARLASGLATAVMMAGLLVTGSRGAFIAACAIFLYFGFRSKFKLQVFGLLAVLASVTLLFPSVYFRFANDPSGQQGSASGRTFIWQTGLYSVREHLFFGTGVGSYSETYDRNLLNVYQASFQGWSRPSHSILVGGLTELGVVGLVFVLAAWYVSFRQLKIIPKTSEWFGLRLAFEGAIVALFAMSLSIDPTYIKYVWLAHSMALMLLNQAAPRVLRLERTPWLKVARPIDKRPAVAGGVGARGR
jgi:O-antigen ligase